MKVSLNLVKHINKHYGCSIDPYTYGIDEILRRIGAQLGAVEEVDHYGQRFNGIVVAKIMSCDKHPDADRLNICKVDDGGIVDGIERDESGYVQVVCGAPNAREGLTIAWLPPGVTVPITIDKDPFIISVREIRGVKSNGMIASAAELGISENHDGILEINEIEVGEDLCRPGTEFKNLYGLDDVIIDCENKMFTHRPDCFGTLGVAREIAGIFGDSYTSPDWYKNPIQNEVSSSLGMSVQNQLNELVPRFMMQAVASVKVGLSPMWLQAYLARVGMKSINNIVDYSNYFMMEIAQPTHAFDYDKVVALCGDNPVFAPRLSVAGEKILLLNGKTIELTDQDIVITANNRPIALAGIMGGSETEVDFTTKNIVIECATFDMYRIRRMSMHHGLFTDAVTRFNKGQSPLQNDKILAKIIDEIVRFTDGEVASEAFDIIDYDKIDIAHDGWGEEVLITEDFINTRLGTELSREDIVRLLENVEFGVELADDVLKIQVPFWRMDIGIPEDIVEEVGRLYGYNKIPVSLPTRNSKPAAKNKSIEIKKDIRNILSRAGANEVLTYSFVHGGLIDKVGQDKQQAYHLRNAISPDLQYYRISLTPSLLAKVNANIRSGCDDFAIFEIGKAHIKNHNDSDGLPKEFERLSFVVASSVDRPDSAYFTAKNFLVYLLNQLEVNSTTVFTTQDSPERDSVDQAATYYQPGRSAVVSLDGEVIGRVGEYNVEVCKALKLPSFCAGFEISTEILGRHISGSANYSPISKYPSIHQDISLRVRLDVSYQQLHDILLQEIDTKKEDHAEVKITPIDIYQGDDHEYKNFAFRLSLVSHIRTLTTEEVNTLLDNIANRAHELCGAVRL
ncbi:phenylalanine--tRNA ligase subunit beta [Candidatus Saccharibacteria bacterium]|jgi:phenylalanyl-tRNA synthetase beta chain|nr:phenylalanine--tRNA ligase subunit beta [Candidatus Saccharibacteria bacterium]